MVTDFCCCRWVKRFEPSSFDERCALLETEKSLPEGMNNARRYKKKFLIVSGNSIIGNGGVMDVWEGRENLGQVNWTPKKWDRICLRKNGAIMCNLLNLD